MSCGPRLQRALVLLFSYRRIENGTERGPAQLYLLLSLSLLVSLRVLRAMLASTLVFLSLFGALVAAQDTASVVCIAGQCVQGFTNLTREFSSLAHLTRRLTRSVQSVLR